MIAKYPGKIAMPEIPKDTKEDYLLIAIKSIIKNDIDELEHNLKGLSPPEDPRKKYKGRFIDFY